MRRDVAEKFVDAVKRIDDIFNSLDEISNQIENEEERKIIRRAMATSILDIHEQITLIVTKEYPDLHPDRL